MSDRRGILTLIGKVLTNISDDKIRFIEIRLVGFIATNPIYKELVRWHHFLVRFSTVADINSIMKSSTAAFPSFLDTVCNKDRISSRLFYILTFLELKSNNIRQIAQA